MTVRIKGKAKTNPTDSSFVRFWSMGATRFRGIWLRNRSTEKQQFVY